MKDNGNIGATTRLFTAHILLGLAILLSSCSRVPTSKLPPPDPETLPAAPSETAIQPPATIPPDAQVLTINPEQTHVHIKVYRDGRLANLGHNHVIAAHGVSGRVWIHDDPAQTGFELGIPVEQLVVDDPEARAQAGEAFARPVSSRDAAATRGNLLGDRVLDATSFPTIHIKSLAIRATASESKHSNLEATIAVTLKGTSAVLLSPVQVVRTGHQLVASGNFSVSHQALNLTPYSALGGALRVRDDIDIEFRIVAVEQVE